MYYREMGLPTVSVRWYNVYGPNQGFHCQKAVPFFIRWALRNKDIEVWGDGTQTVDLIHAIDTVRATIIIANTKKFEGQTIDIGAGEETSVNSLAELIIRKSKSASKIIYLPMRAGESEHTYLKANTTELRKLNFKYLYDLDRGIEETVDWYKKNM